MSVWETLGAGLFMGLLGSLVFLPVYIVFLVASLLVRGLGFGLKVNKEKRRNA